MAGTTLAQAQAQLDAWLAANLAASRNQSYQIGDRSLTRANAAEIREQISYWESEVARLSRSGGGRRVRVVAVS